MTIEIIHGDCREVCQRMAPHSVDSVLTDPPYGLSFMGKDWDHGVPGVEFWRGIAEVCKPGAMLMAFGGTRTFHRLTCAIEDAGWQIRDCLMWLYGEGFPKSLDIGKAIDKAAGAEREVVGKKSKQWGYTLCEGSGQGCYGGGKGLHAPGTDARLKAAQITAPATEAAKKWNGWGTALKPAWEPIILVMKPLDGTFAENAINHGVAGLNIDASRIPIVGPGVPARDIEERSGKRLGRWPSNAILDEEAAAILDRQTRERVKPSGFARSGGGSDEKRDYCASSYSIPRRQSAMHRFGDSGGVSRFFYCAKATKKERGDQPACDMPLFGETIPKQQNIHPTVKPLALLRHLLTLLGTPTGGVVLDPFMGSGSTLLAAKQLGRSAIGIEVEQRYCTIAARRLGQVRREVTGEDG